MMTKRPIRDLHSSKSMPPRFCDVVIEGDRIYLEQKRDKNNTLKIYWEDLLYQVEAAKRDAAAQ